ncbi:dTDP-3-amino-3,4, 6-trideoxy-alpha-D-glucopyranose [Candidatus Electronema halotolerans]
MPFEIFDSYARYYDLLNRDKNYAKEANYIHQLIRKSVPNAKELLDFGCGTGLHAAELAKFGYNVHGIDQSEAMLSLAESRRLNLPQEQKKQLSFSQADIRQLKLNKKFDGIIALFHVVSYLTANTDLLSAFRTVRDHLQPEGIFIFDCWYGPGVLTDRPAIRVREWEDDASTIIRIADPKLYPNENIVNVTYRINIHDKASGRMNKFSEVHRMRYLFLPELQMMLETAGMKICAYHEWDNTKKVNFDSWTLTVSAAVTT